MIQKVFIIFFYLVSIVNAIEIVTIKGGVYNIPYLENIYTENKNKIIKIDSFNIDKYEVSNNRYKKTNIPDDELEYPVVTISYDEAKSFCKRNGGNLPTNQQWIVASSFEKLNYYLYATKQYPILDENNINLEEDRAIELEDSGYGADIDIVDVDKGLIGNNNIIAMLGNVWEMTRTNGEYVILKGGSFYNNQSINLLNNIVENKVLKSELKQYEHIGFRCVYNMDKK